MWLRSHKEWTGKVSLHILNPEVLIWWMLLSFRWLCRFWPSHLKLRSYSAPAHMLVVARAPFFLLSLCCLVFRASTSFCFPSHFPSYHLVTTRISCANSVPAHIGRSRTSLEVYQAGFGPTGCWWGFISMVCLPAHVQTYYWRQLSLRLSLSSSATVVCGVGQKRLDSWVPCFSICGRRLTFHFPLSSWLQALPATATTTHPGRGTNEREI